MSGDFRCFAVSEVIISRFVPGHENTPAWNRPMEYTARNRLLTDETGIIIFGPHQDAALNGFINSDKYKILFKSKKCVNPNYRDSPGRNTVVIFEEKK